MRYQEQVADPRLLHSKSASFALSHHSMQTGAVCDHQWTSTETTAGKNQ